MALVRATCTECGENVEILSSCITLRAQRDLKMGTYEFICPLCRKLVVKVARESIAKLLYGTGCTEVIYSPPVIDLVGGAPMSEDEKIDLILAFMSPTQLDAALDELLG